MIKFLYSIFKRKWGEKMKENNKVALTAVLLILALIIIIVMGFFTYKFYIDKTKETEKSAQLQTQVDSLNETVNDLQEKIDKVSETVNPSNTTNTTNSTSDKTTSTTESKNKSFSNDEIKNAIQKCLNLESSKTNGPGTILNTLGLYKENDSKQEKEQPAEKSGYIKTLIKFNDFKNKMLEYITEECYQREWSEIYYNENGYLCYENSGDSGIEYKVTSIEKSNDSYSANVKASSEGPDRDMIVKFKINEKCVIESYSFEN